MTKGTEFPVLSSAKTEALQVSLQFLLPVQFRFFFPRVYFSFLSPTRFLSGFFSCSGSLLFLFCLLFCFVFTLCVLFLLSLVPWLSFFLSRFYSVHFCFTFFPFLFVFTLFFSHPFTNILTYFVFTQCLQLIYLFIRTTLTSFLHFLSSVSLL